MRGLAPGFVPTYGDLLRFDKAVEDVCVLDRDEDRLARGV